MAGNIYNHHLEILKQNGFSPSNPLNILIVGATGSGKSSTINALLGKEIAKVGEGVAPQTMDIRQIALNSCVVLWDTPGLGDGREADKRHKDLIKSAFKLRVNERKVQIHLVLVIITASSRDLGTTYKVIRECIKPNISALKILYALNQCDLATHPKDWDDANNRPNAKLFNFLLEQAKL